MEPVEHDSTVIKAAGGVIFRQTPAGEEVLLAGGAYMKTNVCATRGDRATCN